MYIRIRMYASLSDFYHVFNTDGLHTDILQCCSLCLLMYWCTYIRTHVHVLWSIQLPQVGTCDSTAKLLIACCMCLIRCYDLGLNFYIFLLYEVIVSSNNYVNA